MKFLRKYRFNICISFLIILFIVVCFYMFRVHLPYSDHKNEIETVKNYIVEEYNYSNVEYFDRYNSDKSYYIIRATKKKKPQYAVYNNKYKFIKSYSGDVVDQQVCIDAFVEKYKQQPSEVSVGYENEIFVYNLMYQGKDSLIYAFYGIDNGEFVKAYRIDNG